MKACIVADPVVIGSSVFLSFSDSLETGTSVGAKGELVDIGADRPQMIWRTDQMKSQVSTCVAVGGCLYGVDGSSNDAGSGLGATLRCLEVDSGAVKWEKPWKTGPVTAAGGKLIALQERGALRILEATPAAYTELSACQLPATPAPRWWVPPVLYRGRIYCRDLSGLIVCIDMRR